MQHSNEVLLALAVVSMLVNLYGAPLAAAIAGVFASRAAARPLHSAHGRRALAH